MSLNSWICLSCKRGKFVVCAKQKWTRESRCSEKKCKTSRHVLLGKSVVQITEQPVYDWKQENHSAQSGLIIPNTCHMFFFLPLMVKLLERRQEHSVCSTTIWPRCLVLNSKVGQAFEQVMNTWGKFIKVPINEEESLTKRQRSVRIRESQQIKSAGLPTCMLQMGSEMGTDELLWVQYHSA